MPVRVAKELADQLAADITKGCDYIGYERSGSLYASYTKTDLQVLVDETQELTDFYLMRGSIEYYRSKNTYSKHSYEYWVAEKLAVRLARWMKRTGQRIYAYKFESPKDRWNLIHMHQCGKRLRDDFTSSFFREGERIGLNTQEDSWRHPTPLIVGICMQGVLIAFDPERLIPSSVMQDFMDSLRLEGLRNDAYN